MKHFILATAIIAFVFNGRAQDIHFSQMPFSPIQLNPALAGANATLQAHVNYRTQWKAVSTPYKTFAFSADGRLNFKKRKRNGHLVAGLNLFNDQSGDAAVTNFQGTVTLGYHLILDPTSTLGVAMYGGFGQRTMDPNKGRWGSQYVNNAFNDQLLSGESFQSNSITYADFGAGLVYRYKDDERYMTSNDGKEFNYGFAMYHVNTPVYSFMTSKDLATDADMLRVRYSIFANGTIGLGNSRVSVMPGIYYQRQNRAQEFLIGTYFKYRITDASKVTGFNKGASLALGAFYRNKDAFVVKGLLEWHDYAIGVAYDVNVSSLSEMSKTRGGVEFVLRYKLVEPRNLIR